MNKQNNLKASNQGSSNLDVSLLNSAESIASNSQQPRPRRLVRRRREGPPTTIVDGILVEEE